MKSAEFLLIQYIPNLNPQRKQNEFSKQENLQYDLQPL